ncbi:MAG: glycosyltransferase family 2 protein [Balneolaceae bacterium]|nr:MAG: glycosyltransferase family 2 protein [Balneolaceae bacterium]
MHHISFSVIIVTWNALHHLKRFLPSVAETDYPNMEIIIADNASADDSATWVKANYPEIKIVTFNQNHGYAGGNNRAVKYAAGDILLFLNNDVRTSPNWLTELNVAFQDENLSIAQPKILSEEAPNYFEYAGASGGFIDWLGYPFCRGRMFDTLEKDNGQYDDQIPIFWASGAAFAIRKELFLEAGGFDEDFEFHMEEIDLCWRCLKKGKIVAAVPKSEVFHLGGGSLPANSPRKVFYNYRNSLVMLLKNLDRFVLIKIFFRLCLDGISGARLFLQGKFSETFAIIRSHFAFYGMVSSTLEKRKDAEKGKSSDSYKSLIFNRLIVSEYFLKGKRTYSEL